MSSYLVAHVCNETVQAYTVLGLRMQTTKSCNVIVS